mmetsp:Transcript_148557/g.370188  ORF Transcript_148557/g.370188 Transcript_148557/m.370188 type:complete len:372 (-) Transcript_148557:167-1282(-)
MPDVRGVDFPGAVGVLLHRRRWRRRGHGRHVGSDTGRRLFSGLEILALGSSVVDVRRVHLPLAVALLLRRGRGRDGGRRFLLGCARGLAALEVLHHGGPVVDVRDVDLRPLAVLLLHLSQRPGAKSTWRGCVAGASAALQAIWVGSPVVDVRHVHLPLALALGVLASAGGARRGGASRRGPWRRRRVCSRSRRRRGRRGRSLLLGRGCHRLRRGGACVRRDRRRGGSRIEGLGRWGGGGEVLCGVEPSLFSDLLCRARLLPSLFGRLLRRFGRGGLGLRRLFGRRLLRLPGRLCGHGGRYEVRRHGLKPFARHRNDILVVLAHEQKLPSELDEAAPPGCLQRAQQGFEHVGDCLVPGQLAEGDLRDTPADP